MSNVIYQQRWVVQSISADTVVLARTNTSTNAQPDHLTNIQATFVRSAGNPVDCNFWAAATTCSFYDITIEKRN